MKTETHMETISTTEEVTTTTYTCEEPGCNFCTEDEDTALNHAGLVHSLAEKKCAAGRMLYRFESRQAVEAWWTAQEAEFRDPLKYTGPGWYYVEEYGQRCPKGCCYDDHKKLVYCSTLMTDLIKERDELNSDIEELSRLCEPFWIRVDIS